MRSKWIIRAIVGIVIVIMVVVIYSEIQGNAVDDERYTRLVENRDFYIAQNDSLRSIKIEEDRIAADSIAFLEIKIQDTEREITIIAAAGRETFIEIIETIPDSMIGLRSLVERREELHIEEVDSLNSVIGDERSAFSVLTGQLRTTNTLLVGVESELVIANDQIVFLENRDDGLSSLESAAIGLSTYIVSTEAFGATTIEGMIIGGGTFLVVKGGSKLISIIGRLL